MAKKYICAVCSEPDSWIILTDKVWALVSEHRRNFLCLLCIEKGLGRKILSKDLKNVPINYTNIIILKRLEDWKESAEYWEEKYRASKMNEYNHVTK